MEFVTRKITSQLAKLACGDEGVLELGNLDAQRDWGYAPDYVKAMWLMMQQDQPDDYVIATGQTHSVRAFLEQAAKVMGFELVWEGEGLKERGLDRQSGRLLVKINPDFFRPAEVDILIGDASKATKKLGWQPEMSFEALVTCMAEADLKTRSRGCEVVLNQRLKSFVLIFGP